MVKAETRLHETHTTLHGMWVRLAEIDGVYLRICGHLDETGNVLAGTLLLRAHSAYRAGVRVAASGQVPESYMVLRGCLEIALTALFIADDHERQVRWMTRSDTPEKRKAFRKEFGFGAMLDHAEQRDPKVGGTARTLYGHLIDFGAHPNDLGLGVVSSLTETADKWRIEQTYIAGDGEIARGVVKTAARVGICALWLFQLVFKERFSLLSLDERIARVAQGT